MSAIEKIRAKNINRVLRDGPAIRKSYGMWIVARDSVRGRVLLGGLGGMGVGEMWTNETERCKEYAGYAEAPDNPLVLDGFGRDSAHSA